MSAMEGLRLGQLELFVTCPLCLELFSQPVRLSTCQHTFCQACIRRVVQRDYQAAWMQCPVCETGCSIHEILDDWRAQKLLEIYDEVKQESEKSEQQSNNGSEEASQPSMQDEKSLNEAKVTPENHISASQKENSPESVKQLKDDHVPEKENSQKDVDRPKDIDASEKENCQKNLKHPKDVSASQKETIQKTMEHPKDVSTSKKENVQKTAEPSKDASASQNSQKGIKEPKEVSAPQKETVHSSQKETSQESTKQPEETKAPSVVKTESVSKKEMDDDSDIRSVSSSSSDDLDVDFKRVDGTDLINVEFLKRFALDQAMEGILAEQETIQVATEMMSLGHDPGFSSAEMKQKQARLKELKELKEQVEYEQEKNKEQLQEKREAKARRRKDRARRRAEVQKKRQERLAARDRAKGGEVEQSSGDIDLIEVEKKREEPLTDTEKDRTKEEEMELTSSEMTLPEPSEVESSPSSQDISPESGATEAPLYDPEDIDDFEDVETELEAMDTMETGLPHCDLDQESSSDYDSALEDNLPTSNQRDISFAALSDRKYELEKTVDLSWKCYAERMCLIEGNLWLAAYDDGVYIYDTNCEETKHLKPIAISSKVRGVTLTQGRDVMVACDDGTGLVRLTEEGGYMATVYEGCFSDVKFSDNMIYALEHELSTLIAFKLYRKEDKWKKSWEHRLDFVCDSWDKIQVEDDHIYVSSVVTNTVFVYRVSGKLAIFVKKMAISATEGDGECPLLCDVDSSGRPLICDYRMQQLFYHQSENEGWRPLQLSQKPQQPMGAIVSDDLRNVFVVTRNKQLLKFSQV